MQSTSRPVIPAVSCEVSVSTLPGEIRHVASSPFDFRADRRLGDVIYEVAGKSFIISKPTDLKQTLSVSGNLTSHLKWALSLN
jgi:hypothetical protein